MRKPIALLTLTAFAAVATTACGGSASTASVTADEARSAVPTSSSATVGTPADRSSGASAQAAAGGSSASAAFDPSFSSSSEYATVTYYTAWTMNLGVRAVLGTVGAITAGDPSDCTDDTCTWGPYQEYLPDGRTPARRWRLVVQKVADGQYAYALTGQNVVKGTEWLEVLAGNTTEPSYGKKKGDFSINFDNARQVNTALKVYGVLNEKFSNVGDPTLDATFVGAHNVKTDEIIDAAYRFSSTSAGGDLQIAFQSQSGSSPTLSLHSRWDATGAGRGDAHYYAASSTTTVTYGASECWDDQYTLTYDNDPAYGSVSYCASAFQGDAQYATLTIP